MFKIYVMDITQRLVSAAEIADFISSISSTSPREALGKVILFLTQITDSDIGSIYEVDSLGEGLEIKFVVEKSDDKLTLKPKSNTFIPFDKGIVGWVYRNKAPYISDNLSSDKFFIPLSGETKSEITIPVYVKNEVLYIINLESFTETKYTKESLELVSLISTIFSNILEKLLEIEKKNLEITYYRILSRVYKATQNINELDTAFKKIMNILVEEVSIERGMIFLFDETDKETLRIVQSFGLTEEEKNKGVYRVGEGIIGNVAKNLSPIFVPNIWKDKRFLNKTGAKRAANKRISFFATPIVFGNELLGVMSIEKEFKNIAEFETIGKLLNEISNNIAISVMHYIKRKEETNKLLSENEELKKQLASKYKISNIIGKSEKMLEVFRIVNIVSDTNSTVLIEGESGTGKELIAKAIHFNSSRRNMPFVSLNCAAIPETLLESELFGYKKGSFTGATSDKKGKILLANGGTLFLDEIGDMPLSLQAKLLRVLQEKEVEPIGGLPTKVDVRIIAATNKNLQKLVEEGKFRLDLFYRLNVIKISLPPLRERKEDIPLLVDEFIRKFSVEHKKNIRKVDKEAMNILMEYDWPGNVRELENVIERAVILCQSDTITFELLPKEILLQATSHANYEEKISEIISKFIEKADINNENMLYDKLITPVEKTIITKVLLKTNNNKLKASKILGINRNTLDSYLKKHNLQ
jgi:Nif-specific regulatory protein